MSGLLLATFTVFTALALFAPSIIQSLTARHRLRRPHRVLMLIFRIWFGLLALATVALIFTQLRVSR